MSNKEEKKGLAELKRIFGEENLQEVTLDDVPHYALSRAILDLPHTNKDDIIATFKSITCDDPDDPETNSPIRTDNPKYILTVPASTMEEEGAINVLKDSQLSDFSKTVNLDARADQRNDDPNDTTEFIRENSPQEEWLKKLFGPENIEVGFIRNEDGTSEKYFLIMDGAESLFASDKRTKHLTYDRLRDLLEETFSAKLNEAFEAHLREDLESINFKTIDQLGEHLSPLYDINAIIVPKRNLEILIALKAEEGGSQYSKPLQDHFTDINKVIDGIEKARRSKDEKEQRNLKKNYDKVAANPSKYPHVHLDEEGYENIKKFPVLSPLNISHDEEQGRKRKGYTPHLDAARLKKMFGIQFTRMENGMYRSQSPLQDARKKCAEIVDLLGLDAETCRVSNDASGDYLVVNANAAYQAFCSHTQPHTHTETVRAKDGRVVGYSSINTDTFVKDAMIKELHKIMGAEAQRGK